jgi:hypothetical protein
MGHLSEQRELGVIGWSRATDRVAHTVQQPGARQLTQPAQRLVVDAKRRGLVVGAQP